MDASTVKKVQNLFAIPGFGHGARGQNSRSLMTKCNRMCDSSPACGRWASRSNDFPQDPCHMVQVVNLKAARKTTRVSTQQRSTAMQTPRSFRHDALVGILAIAILPFTPAATALEAVRISPDKRSFILAESGKTFRVWGVNYDHDSKGENGRLLEDYWHDEWETVRSDFEEMKALGANVVRVHLQFAKFMRAADTPNQDSLNQLRRLLELAE